MSVKKLILKTLLPAGVEFLDKILVLLATDEIIDFFNEWPHSLTLIWIGADWLYEYSENDTEPIISDLADEIKQAAEKIAEDNKIQWVIAGEK